MEIPNTGFLMTQLIAASYLAVVNYYYIFELWEVICVRTSVSEGGFQGQGHFDATFYCSSIFISETGTRNAKILLSLFSFEHLDTTEMFFVHHTQIKSKI